MTGWTRADGAEQDVLVHELVDGYFDARERLHDEDLRRALGVALDVVLGWRRRRMLVARAARLRAEQDFQDWKTEARCAATRREAT